MPTVIPTSLADQIIAAKISEWEQKRSASKDRKKSKEIQTYPFLTISRDFGCGEEEIIPKLEKDLKWKVYGRNLLDRLAQRESLSRNFMETLDEQKKSLLDDWIQFLTRSGAVLQDDYVIKISQMMKVIVSQESAIILGRGANYVLNDKKEGLNVKMTAPFQYRVENIMRVRGLTKAKAQKLVSETDKERVEFIKRYFNVNREQRVDVPFDLTINTKYISSKIICNAITMILEEKIKASKKS
jgi:cytidylate kinase